MRVPMVSILLAGGVMALGACASVESAPMTLAERTEQCQRTRTEAVPTGRETGDARQDYSCRGANAVGYPERRGDARRNAAVDRALSTGM